MLTGLDVVQEESYDAYITVRTKSYILMIPAISRVKTKNGWQVLEQAVLHGNYASWSDCGTPREAF